MPYDATGKALAKAYVSLVRQNTMCARCGAQPIEWHNETHSKGRESQRIAGLAARADGVGPDALEAAYWLGAQDIKAGRVIL